MLAQGEVRYFAPMIDAANAFAKATEPFKNVIYDDGCTACHLNGDEQRLLENVCTMLGYERSRARRVATNGVYKRRKWELTRRAVLARDPICKV